MSRRDPLERIVDLVVAVPVSMLAAVRELMPFDTGPAEHRLGSLVGRNRELITRYGTQQSAEMPTARQPSRVVPHSAPEAATPPPSPDTASPNTASPGSALRSPVAADDEPLPIDGYDQLSARQIVDRLGELTPVELAAVASHERRNRRRQTVLGRIEQLS